ncbi:energy-coupling factor transporter transmembrane protein EcfT [Lactobacillus sp. YT155]|uniref:energy-coupling factor transporter transmembrane component T family protein n=1 Tax=Lactobacillus sp. YT155 TaxID=3060955 RepID=UPI0026604E5C|nr:energy-coupling factor transporter transmembrane protein EcfT [Lactobacillus sp. YT155]MDO1604527.1 energy-coupling factor transporter transmembrane protein EcfT [Lactobacillus sp. YT155]
MNKLIVGRYIPGNSIIHNLDPRAKFIGTFYFIGIIFLANSWYTYLPLFLFVLFALKLSNVPMSFFFKGLRPLMWLILFTVILQVFFTPGEQIFWQWWIFSLSWQSIINGTYIFVRFVLIVFFSTLLTLTTTPVELSDAIEAVMKPLKVVRFPVTQVALMLSIALRFVPQLMDQTTKIMNAQRARGVDFGTGSIMKRIKSFIPLLIPLFVSSFSIAYDLSIAMESRGYQGGENRTKYRELIWQRNDTLMVVTFVLITLLLAYLRFGI